MSIYSVGVESYKNDSPSKLLPNKKLSLQIKAKEVQLQKELESLAKAHEVGVRSRQARELEFRTKYEKYLTRGNFESTLLKKEGFKKFNKEMTIHNNELKPSQHIPPHKLIYTNGEVDIEKVVCLHLLTVQSIDAAIFVKNKDFSLFPKRSRQNMIEASVLPFYILEITNKINSGQHLELREGQDVVIMVNSNLEKLIISILEVLAIVSPLKLKQINLLSFNKRGIQEIMKKTKIHNFLTQIKECPALFSITNYRLEIARYQTEASLMPNVLSLCQVRVKDKSGKLEQIQNKIHAIITKYSESQINTNESWSMFHKKFCSCRKALTKNAMTPEKGISLLLDDGSEFALVTGAGCHLPSGSSELCPSLTAIIKSSPKPPCVNIVEQSSRFSVNHRYVPLPKNDQKKLKSSLLNKINNKHRIFIGKKAAEFKPQSVIENKVRPKIAFNKLIEEVFSTESLISFASTIENDELKLLFQPCCKGGLGLGSFLLQPDNDTSKNKATSSFNTEALCDYEDEAVQLLKQDKSLMNTAIIKQDIFTSETRTKIKEFLVSENPGTKNVQNIDFL